MERCLHGCWWTDDGRLTLYAGQTTGVPALGDLWQLAPGPRIGTNSWSEVTPGARWPADRQLYASARWGAATVVFGGGSLGGGFLDDTWLLGDSGRATRAQPGGGPAASSGAELIADPERGRLLLFGGRNADDAMRDTWELTTAARVISATAAAGGPPPGCRSVRPSGRRAARTRHPGRGSGGAARPGPTCAAARPSRRALIEESAPASRTSSRTASITAAVWWVLGAMRTCPRLAGGPIRPLDGAPLAGAHRVGGQEPAGDQPFDVVEHRARVSTEPPGELLVRHRLIQRQAQDAQPQRMAERPHLLRCRVADGRFFLTGGHFPIGGLLSTAL